MTPAQIIVLATPVFLLLIALEVWVGQRRGQLTLRLNDALSSIGLGMISQVLGLFTKLFAIGLYTLAWQHLALWHLPADAWWVWLSGLLLYDLCYYALHRAGHRVALLWAAHVVHHQSEEYNLSTALRQTATGWLGGWLFYLPMALLGFPPLVFGVVALIDLLYQFWVHTRQIGKLGWFDRWFCSPSNHRVHHAVNDRYLDHNYGGILMVWDRLFGTFIEEDELDLIVYGTRKPLRSWNPLWANLEVYAALAQDSWRARGWADKLRIWFKPPGWRPPELALRFPAAAFDLHRPTFDPPVARGTVVLATSLFVLALGGTAALLWHAHLLTATQQGAAAALVLGMMTLSGWLLQRPGASSADQDQPSNNSPLREGGVSPR
jgi:sterol desaturase/sphingolipid hydroxylase (fatty acid hydroxylase superfamily)